MYYRPEKKYSRKTIRSIYVASQLSWNGRKDSRCVLLSDLGLRGGLNEESIPEVALRTSRELWCWIWMTKQTGILVFADGTDVFVCDDDVFV